MSLRRLDLADIPPTPWANGLGKTREFLRRRTPDGALICRIAVADVTAPGPFSVLPGIDRTLVLIAGEGFELRCGEQLLTVRALEPVSFSGDEAFVADRVAGPSRDLNVMTGRGVAVGTVVVHRTGFADTAADLSCYYVTAGAFRASVAEGGMLAPGELVEVLGERGRPITFEGSGAVIAIHVTRAEGADWAPSALASL
jgi:environmental stress-induced protein Ves